MYNEIPAIGFISPPGWFDPAPSEFPAVCHDAVATQQAPLPLPDFDWRLENVAGVAGELRTCARMLAQSGCDMVAQVGTPFAWAGVSSEVESRERCGSLADAAGVPVSMTGLAIVDALRALGTSKIALAATYYPPEWRDAWAYFVELCDFDVAYIANLADQGLVTAGDLMSEYGWSMTLDLTRDAIMSAARNASDADAIVVTGAGTRTLALLNELESAVGCPVVGADVALYWAVIRELGLTPKPVLGALASAL